MFIILRNPQTAEKRSHMRENDHFDDKRRGAAAFQATFVWGGGLSSLREQFSSACVHSG